MQYTYSYVQYIYGWGETGIREIDELLSKVFGIKEAELFSEDADVPPDRAEDEYEGFMKGIEKVCSEYRARGWTVDCGDFSGDGGDYRELAYEAYFEPPEPINGEWWFVYAVFKYFMDDGFGKSWLTLVRTRETNNDFLNWLREEIRGVMDEDEVWKRVMVKQVGGEYREVSRQASMT